MPDAEQLAQIKAERSRSLAAMVVLQAVRDASGRHGAVETKKTPRGLLSEARAFLRADDPDLNFWCDVLNLDPAWIERAAQEIYSNPERSALMNRAYVTYVKSLGQGGRKQRWKLVS